MMNPNQKSGCCDLQLLYLDDDYLRKARDLHHDESSMVAQGYLLLQPKY
jgi:hypothetical protein